MSRPADDLARLRHLVFANAFPKSRKLSETMASLAFVQYDPIQRPARAQDLILHQRVAGYRAGGLDRFYPRSDFEEGFLYAHGALAGDLAALLHPAADDSAAPDSEEGLTRDVLAFVCEAGPVRPQQVAAALGKESATNGWGGTSSATTICLQRLHRQGLLRIARREAGNKVYEAATVRPHGLSPRQRLKRLALAILRILAPVSDAGLGHALRLMCHVCPDLKGALEGRRSVVDGTIAEGEVAALTVDGVRYLAPAELLETEPPPTRRTVRFLAPFDPAVWERGRFEHLWGWPYRFEAYTPESQRKMGYYALPMAWGERLVGWVNVEAAKDGPLDVAVGFAGRPLQGKAFRRSFDKEVARMERFLFRV